MKANFLNILFQLMGLTIIIQCTYAIGRNTTITQGELDALNGKLSLQKVALMKTLEFVVSDKPDKDSIKLLRDINKQLEQWNQPQHN